MTTFQILLLIALALMLLLTVVAMIRGWASRPHMALWAFIWTAGLLAAAMPDATTRLANAVGIDRGKDLLLYCATLVMMLGFFGIYLRLRRVRRELTLLVRRVALMEAERTGSPAARSSLESPETAAESPLETT